MNIQIETIDVIEDKIYIIFSSEYGVGKARWCSNNFPEYQKYTVEINYSEKFILNQNMFLSNNEKTEISIKENITLINIVVEDVEKNDENYLLYLRIGNLLIMIESEIEIYIGTFISIESPSLEVYDMNE